MTKPTTSPRRTWRQDLEALSPLDRFLLRLVLNLMLITTAVAIITAYVLDWPHNR